MPVSRRPTRRFRSEGLPPRRRQGSSLSAGSAVARPHRSVGRADLRRRGCWQPSDLAFGLPRPERTSTPAAGADPAPLQDASGSTPHGQDVFCIFLLIGIVKNPLRRTIRHSGARARPASPEPITAIVSDTSATDAPRLFCPAGGYGFRVLASRAPE